MSSTWRQNPEICKYVAVFVFTQIHVNVSVCRTGGMASCILNFGDLWKGNVTFKTRSFVPAVRNPAARKPGSDVRGCIAAVSKQIEKNTNSAQYVELAESLRFLSYLRDISYRNLKG
jgi:hypothetical protein